jgi:hypothetical protein
VRWRLVPAVVGQVVGQELLVASSTICSGVWRRRRALAELAIAAAKEARANRINKDDANEPLTRYALEILVAAFLAQSEANSAIHFEFYSGRRNS